MPLGFLGFISPRFLLNVLTVSCIFSILLSIFWNFFTIITLNSFSDRLPGRTGWWEGREAREEAELGIIMADSLLLYDRNQHNIVKIKKKKKELLC